ncbi:permease [Parasalinivibrio latis]|uniref:permease n=1 Tax=Parasalinivibrio latis TaxID=2952610 RepID=UPI0030E2DA61
MEHEGGMLIMHVINTFAGMVWQIYWPLAFGLMLSSLLRHVLPVDTVADNLGKTTPKSLALTTVLGMVSSSCSYAAASLSRTLLIKKATLSNAMAFLVSSTNLILEMFIVLVTLLGWQFLWGEVAGGLLLIVIVATLFHLVYPKEQEQALRTKLSADENPASQEGCGMSGMDHSGMKHEMGDHCDMPEMDHSGSMGHGMAHEHMDHSDKPEHGQMEHAHMSHGSMHDHCGESMSAPKKETLGEKICRSAGYFQMDISMIGKEILIGVVISSLLIAVIPQDWWREVFISNQLGLPSWLHSLLDVVIGIFVAVIAYVCSVGNLLLAAALWHGGISFGGVMGFILADVLTIPMTRVYAKYYGKEPAKWMVGLLFIAILITGLLLDAISSGIDWSASRETVRTLHEAGFGVNFTTIMNLIFIPLSVWYYQTGKKANANMGMSM